MPAQTRIIHFYLCLGAAGGKECEVIMLGPQVRHTEKKLKTLTSKPIEIINMRDYGMMNGEKVLDAALKLIK